MQIRPVRRPHDLEALDRLFEDAHTADGHWPLGEHKYHELLTGDGADAIDLVVESRGDLIGSAHMVPNRETRGWGLELAVHPLHRSHDVLGELVRAALNRIAEAGGHAVRCWAYQPAVAGILHELGFEQDRELHQLRRMLPTGAAPAFPAGYVVRPFRVGVDEDVWLAVNNRAFAGHPENGEWDRRILDEREQLDWFDPAGFRLAWKGSRLAAFCWTKMHDDGIGEIYVIAVDPDFQGRGLGRASALDGLDYLTAVRHADVAMLYVDASNEGALRLYEGLGFYLDHVDRSFIISV